VTIPLSPTANLKLKKNGTINAYKPREIAQRQAQGGQQTQGFMLRIPSVIRQLELNIEKG
jgi:hypothetical protein